MQNSLFRCYCVYKIKMSDEQSLTIDNNVDLFESKEADFKEIKSSELNTSAKEMEMIQRSTGNIEDNQSGKESNDSQDFVLDIFVNEDDILNDGAINEVIHDMKVSNTPIKPNKFNAIKQLNHKYFEIAHSGKEEKTQKKKIVFQPDVLTEVKSDNNVIVDKAKNDHLEEKKVIKLSENSVKETSAEVLKKRAERFGIASSPPKKIEPRERREKRKERTRPIVTSAAKREYKRPKRAERFKPSFKSMKY